MYADCYRKLAGSAGVARTAFETAESLPNKVELVAVIFRRTSLVRINLIPDFCSH